MPVAGSRQVQVCKRQRDEAERKRCESHNPSGARPALVPLSSFCVPAPSVPGDVSFTTSQRSKTPFQLPSYLNNSLNQDDFRLLTCFLTQIPLRRDPFGHLHLCQIYLDFFLEPAAHFPVTPSFVWQVCFHQRGAAQVMVRQQRLPHSQPQGRARCSLVARQL